VLWDLAAALQVSDLLPLEMLMLTEQNAGIISSVGTGALAYPIRSSTACLLRPRGQYM